MTKEAKTEPQTSPINGVVGMPFKDVMSVLPAVIAGLTVLVFTASAAREWAYYYVIGADFISLASPADYTSAALRWLPPFVLLCVISTLFEMFLSRTEGFQSEEELAQGFSKPRAIRFFRALPYRLGLAGMIVGGFLYAARADNPTAMKWLPFFVGCWIVFSKWFVRHPRVYYKLARTGRLLLFFGPAVAAYVLADGYDEASSDLVLPRGEYRIVHSTGLVEDNVQLLRALSQGVLILRVPTRDVSFLTYGSFKSIDKIGSSQ